MSPGPYTRMPFPQAREQVAAVARLVPAGRVVSYGDIAALLRLSPRAVGRAMATLDALDEDPAATAAAARDDRSPNAASCAHDPPPGTAGEVPWWRVTNASGDLPPHLRDEAFARYRDEAIGIRPDGRGAAIRTHRADLPSLADAAEAVLGPLPGAND